MKSLFFFLAISSLWMFTSCHSTSYQELPDDTLLDQLLANNPDSLANLLENDIDPFLLTDIERADYGWWLTNAHRRQNRSLINDTLIFYTLDYYKTIDSPRLSGTYLLAAEQVNSSGNQLLERRSIIEEALELSRIKKDTAMVIETIARLANTYDLGEDVDRLQELIQITKDFSNNMSDIHSIVLLMRLYTRTLELDSVGVYSAMGMKMAREQNMPYLDYLFSREYSKYLNFKGRDKEALEVLKALEGRMQVGNELMLNYIVTWGGLNNMDSVQVYIDSMKVLMNENRYKAFDEVYLVDIILTNLENTLKARNGKKISMYDMGSSPDRMLSYSRNMIKADRERQFMQNKLLKEKLMLDIERGKLKQRSLWGGIILLMIVAVMIFIYQRKLLKKERIVQQAKEQLRLRSLQLSENESIINKNEELIKELSEQLDESGDYQQEINVLVEENKKLDQNNKLLQKDIEQYSKSIILKDEELSVYEQLMEHNSKLQERERFLTVQLIAHTPVLDKLSKKPRYIEESQWPEIFQAVNQLFDGFTYRLHTNFSTLTDEDIRYCTLIRLRLSTSVISTLTGISPSSVTKRKQRIKEKMNQQHPDEILKEQPLEIYLWNY